GAGYDLVYYEILSEKDEKLYLLAYREKLAGTELVSSNNDNRPTRIDLYVENTDGSGQLSSYRINGDLFETTELSAENLIASREGLLSLSTPLLTAGP
ncbi:MAG: hypothetical protein KDD22_07465, partial [Bdellovibrionales bacterium]|nr:hypothetical protein [Bdellovibrionales bacterium]